QVGPVGGHVRAGGSTLEPFVRRRLPPALAPAVPDQVAAGGVQPGPGLLPLVPVAQEPDERLRREVVAGVTVTDEVRGPAGEAPEVRLVDRSHLGLERGARRQHHVLSRPRARDHGDRHAGYDAAAPRWVGPMLAEGRRGGGAPSRADIIAAWRSPRWSAGAGWCATTTRTGRCRPRCSSGCSTTRCGRRARGSARAGTSWCSPTRTTAASSGRRRPSPGRR